MEGKSPNTHFSHSQPFFLFCRSVTTTMASKLCFLSSEAEKLARQMPKSPAYHERD